MYVVGKAYRGKKYLGYILNDKSIIDRDQLLKLAKQGEIQNVGVRIDSKGAYLVGKGCNLKQLKKYEIPKSESDVSKIKIPVRLLDRKSDYKLSKNTLEFTLKEGSTFKDIFEVCEDGVKSDIDKKIERIIDTVEVLELRYTVDSVSPVHSNKVEFGGKTYVYVYMYKSAEAYRVPDSLKQVFILCINVTDRKLVCCLLNTHGYTVEEMQKGGLVSLWKSVPRSYCGGFSDNTYEWVDVKRGGLADSIYKEGAIVSYT